jgi:hypothetical protein
MSSTRMTTKLGRSEEGALGSGCGGLPEQLSPKNSARRLERIEVESIGFFLRARRMECDSKAPALIESETMKLSQTPRIALTPDAVGHIILVPFGDFEYLLFT